MHCLIALLLLGRTEFNVDPTTNTAVKVDMQIFARKDVKKLGVAPLTSMFYHGENSTKFFDDYRPEVHDSDGLLTQISRQQMGMAST